MTDLEVLLHHAKHMHRRLVSVEQRLAIVERLLRWAIAAAAAGAAGHGVNFLL